MIPIGKIVGAFGLDGRMKVEMLTTFEERFAVGETVFLKGVERQITWVAWHKTQVRLRLEGITTPEQVEDLRWELLEVDPSNRPELDEDEFYAGDLIGMMVRTSDGKELGPLDAVLDYPAHEVFRVGETLIPAVKQFVKLIDFETNTITVELIPGMLPGEEGA